MKISELKIKKTTRRATRNFDSDGKRIYEEFEYDMPYKSTFNDEYRKRRAAKIIDITAFLLLLNIVFKLSLVISLLWAIILVILFGSITETLWGNTIGKKIFKLKVVDECGKYPVFRKSMMRNIFCIINFCPKFSERTTKSVAWGVETHFETHMSMYLNNKICKTYIIKESTLINLKKLLATQKPIL